MQFQNRSRTTITCVNIQIVDENDKRDLEFVAIKKKCYNEVYRNLTNILTEKTYVWKTEPHRAFNSGNKNPAHFPRMP